jgi:hypothetical protein
VLFEYSYLNSPSTTADQLIDTICFNTLSRGQLQAKRVVSDGTVKIELNFPSQPPSPFSFSEKELSFICRGLGIEANEILFSERALDVFLIEISPETFIKIPSLASGGLDFTALSCVEARGVIVTCIGPNSSSSTQSPLASAFPNADFLSRFFAPRSGSGYPLLCITLTCLC